MTTIELRAWQHAAEQWLETKGRSRRLEGFRVLLTWAVDAFPVSRIEMADRLDTAPRGIQVWRDGAAYPVPTYQAFVIRELLEGSRSFESKRELPPL